VVEGLGELALEKGLRLNPDDLDKLGIKSGEPVTISLNGKKITVSAKADSECRTGTAYLYRPINFGGLAEHAYLEFFNALYSNPAKVSIE
jgi:anaerobic selenocysteine-containing dehydrogenase